MRVALVCVLLVLAGACAGRKAPGTTRDLRDYTEKGKASWYGKPYHGRLTANGERYDMNEMTAAHKTLPFDTVVRVKNLQNGREIQVRINDRGPFVDGRIIDLSRRAAKKLDMIGPGVVPVVLHVVEVPRR